MWPRGRDQERARIAGAVKEALLAKTHRMAEASFAFICDYDIAQVWAEHLKALSRGLDWGSEESLGYVRSKLIKVLSILVFIGWNSWKDFTSLFIRHVDSHGKPDRTDNHLPFTASFLGSLEPNFRTAQYIFIPAIIKQDDPARDRVLKFPREYRMPFIRTESIRQGAHGSVTKECIAPGYFQNMSGDANRTSRWYARKSFDGRTSQFIRSFETEKDSLKRFKECSVKHENIMLSLATFIHGTDFNIISPLADLDLNDFLTGNYPGFSTRIENEGFTPQHLLQEAACLAGALNYLHQGLEIRGRGGYMACAHMDLKPDNILVSWRPPDGPELAVGQWMIHDFGTSRIKESNRMPQTHLAPGDFLREMSLTKSQRQPGPFQAPEVQNDTEKTCGRESDCWSFGCILTVILAFALGGPEMVDDLFQCIDNGVDDYFYTVEGDRKILKPQVLQWLDRLKVGPSEHVWVRKYKHVIMALLKIAPEERLKAQVVRDELNKISRDGGESLQARCTSRWPSRTLISPPSPLRITPRTESANPPHASPATPRHRGHLPTLIVTSRDDSQSSVSASSADQHSLARPPLESDTSITSDELARLLGGSTLGPMTRARFSLASQPAASIFMRLETPGSSFTSRLAPSCERVLFLSRSAAKLYHIDLLESHNDWAAKRDARLIKSATVANCHREIVCERGREWTYAGIAGPFVALISRAKDSKQLKTHLFEISQGYGVLGQVDPKPVKPTPVTPVGDEPVDVTVSSVGDLLLHFDDYILFCPFQSSGWTTLKVAGRLQEATFSADGAWIYGWSCQDQYDYWYVWRADTGVLQYGRSEREKRREQRGRSRNILMPLSVSPAFVVCEVHGSITIVECGGSRPRSTRLHQEFNGVIAATVTPSENAIVLVQRPPAVHPKYEIMIAPLFQEDVDLAKTTATAFGQLQSVHETRSRIAVRESESESFLLVSHSDGVLERKRLRP